MKLWPLRFNSGLVFLLIICLAVELFAYWWTHPSFNDKSQPKLIFISHYALALQKAGAEKEESSSKPLQELLRQESDKFTPMPEVIKKTCDTLMCSNGFVAKIERASGVVIHIAFFEWNRDDSVNVLEAYRHLPDECMGSIGMKLVSKSAPRTYVVENETIVFDHTTFLDHVGKTIHAFKGTWVSGATSLLGSDLRGGADQWRQIRYKAAFSRFKPAYARVAQGAVRGIQDPEKAWMAFEESMLRDLSFEK